MKDTRTVTMPVCWSGIRARVQKDSDEQRKFLIQSLEEGFTVTHITSSTVNDVMYVYHFLEKEIK